MSTTRIKTEGLGKSYRLGLNATGNLRETVTNVTTRLLGGLRGSRERRPKGEVLWALRDVSIEIADGEVVGLIGHNGAGKSTMLKLISRITEPSAGWADVTGRIGSLLEVGTGFHPELTGRENIFLNGAILGMRRSEIRRRFDAIVEFAEVERFLDTPVKRYSSGMSVRLAFAVAAHLEPEILLVDEVLSVGDASFQRRSLTKMEEVARDGRTVVFVSHNLGTIRHLCQRGILLSQGEVLADTTAPEAIDEYLSLVERTADEDLLERRDRPRIGEEETFLKRVVVTDDVSGREDVVVGGHRARIAVEVSEPLPRLECQIIVVNSLGQPVTRLDSAVSAPSDVRDPGLETEMECTIDQLPLTPGRYRLDVRISGNEELQDVLDAAAYFDVEQGVLGDRPMHTDLDDGDVAVPHSWRLPP